jgi:hypothetical protein
LRPRRQSRLAIPTKFSIDEFWPDGLELFQYENSVGARDFIDFGFSDGY